MLYKKVKNELPKVVEKHKNHVETLQSHILEYLEKFVAFLKNGILGKTF